MLDPEHVTVGDGEPGGKGRGLLRVGDLLAALAAREEHAAFTRRLALPRTVFVATGVYREFVELNALGDRIREAERGGPERYEALAQAFLAGRFSEATRGELRRVLGSFRRPLAVRSSSLLEDQKQASFAGKYESVLIANHGAEEGRLDGLQEALKRVYASTHNPSALAYRRKRGFAEDREEMAVVVQEIVGQPYQRYYLPALAGVAFSQNAYCWSPDMRRQDGLVRLVLGLGTRAVGRGYVRLFSPARPELRPEGTEVNNILKCSQKNVDVIDLEAGAFASIHFRELLGEGPDRYPPIQAMVSLKEGNHLYRPVTAFWDPAHDPVLTMDGVLAREWMGMNVPRTVGWLLRELERGLGFAVDVEFAIDPDPGTQQARLHVLQVRPLSRPEELDARPLPADLRDRDVIVRVRRNLPTAWVPDLEYLVWVDDVAYDAWPHRDKQTVARIVGKLNHALAGKRFALFGPGRWGSWNPELGVPVRYSEICHTALLVEVARRKATYLPEVSMGSHFFQDLIEDRIAYLPVYPDEPNEHFNQAALDGGTALADLLEPDEAERFASLIKVVHVPSVSAERRAHAILNGETGEAVVFLGAAAG